MNCYFMFNATLILMTCPYNCPMNESVCTAEKQSDCTKLCVPEYYCEYNITKKQDTNITKYCNTDYNSWGWEIEKTSCPSESDCSSIPKSEDSLCYLECQNQGGVLMAYVICSVMILLASVCFGFCCGRVRVDYLCLYMLVWPILLGFLAFTYSALGFIFFIFICCSCGENDANNGRKPFETVASCFCFPFRCGDDESERAVGFILGEGFKGREEREPEEFEMLRSNIQ